MKKFRNERIATEFLYSRYQAAKNIQKNSLRLLKVKRVSWKKELFIWSIKIASNLFGGVDINGQDYTFKQSDIIDWSPYNGEALSEYEHIIIHPSLGIIIDVIEVKDEKHAERIILDCGEFHCLQNEFFFLSRYCFDKNSSTQELRFYWAKRIDLLNYVAVDIRTGNTDIIASNEKVNFLFKGDKVENFVLVEESGIMLMRKRQ